MPSNCTDTFALLYTGAIVSDVGFAADGRDVSALVGPSGILRGQNEAERSVRTNGMYELDVLSAATLFEECLFVQCTVTAVTGLADELFLPTRAVTKLSDGLVSEDYHACTQARFASQLSDRYSSTPNMEMSRIEYMDNF